MAKDFSHPKVVENYDEHIRKLIPGYELVHLQIQSILQTELKSNARVVVAGCGTGYELEYLMRILPEVHFIVFDPSELMIAKAQQRFEHQADLNRIEFHVADHSILAQYTDQFDAALAILVSHFLNPEVKKAYFKALYSSLKDAGFCLSYDLMQFHNQSQILQLQYLTQSLGLSEKQSQSMIERIADDFDLIPIDDMQQLLRNCGFRQTTCFAQVLNFYAIQSTK